jgi:quercetin dioxygenase-like cupin family protein
MCDESGSTGGYTSFSNATALDAGDGIVLRPVAGKRIMLSEVTAPAHSVGATHTHEEEKLGVVLSGSCEFTLAGVTRQLGPGDIYQVPPTVPHGFRATEDCVLLDVFSPPRPDLLKRMT